MDEAGFKGKTAIVTGSSAGIGAAVALRLGRDGANVVVNYAGSERLAADVVAAVMAAGGRAIAVQGDVSRDDDCRKIAAAARDTFGAIDILVNNAGITKFAAHNDLDALSEADFQRLYGVNVIGAYQMVRAAAADLKTSGMKTGGMKTGGSGAIVNIASIAGSHGIGSSIAYAASKGALITMTKSLARALAPKVRVNAVCPGFVDSQWFVRAFGADKAARMADDHKQTVPLDRVASPEDVAETVAFFAGSASRHVTGETLLVDGGLHLTTGFAGFR